MNEAMIRKMSMESLLGRAVDPTDNVDLYYDGNMAVPLTRPCVSIAGFRGYAEGGAAEADGISRDLGGAGIITVRSPAFERDPAAYNTSIGNDSGMIIVGTSPFIDLVSRDPPENGEYYVLAGREYLLVSPPSPGLDHVLPDYLGRTMAAMSDAVVVDVRDNPVLAGYARMAAGMGRRVFVRGEINMDGIRDNVVRLGDLQAVARHAREAFEAGRAGRTGESGPPPAYATFRYSIDPHGMGHTEL